MPIISLASLIRGHVPSPAQNNYLFNVIVMILIDKLVHYHMVMAKLNLQCSVH